VSARTPRLWVPGLAYFTDAGDVHLGRNAGYNGQGPAFRGLRFGRRGRLASWTHVAWLVQRSALHPGRIDAHGLTFPESLIDSDAQPHAHRWLREQPLVCVSGGAWRQLADGGVRVYRVAFDAAGRRELDIEGINAPGGPSSLTVGLDALESAMTAAWNGHTLLDVQGDPSPIDRALRLVSDGALDEASVLNAFDARCLIEPGYGYRGAEHGQLADIDRVARECRPVDAVFGQIFERAGGMRALAERLLTALSHAAADASEVGVPVYGVARRLIVPALHVRGASRLVLHGEARDELELSSERRWSVDGVDAWNPMVPADKVEPRAPSS
jgi:hypothetical protein